MTTPTFTSPVSILTGNGADALSHTTRPLLEPTLVNGVEPSTAPVSSLTNHARALFGFTSGTAIGKAPAALSFWKIDTRACALMYGTLVPRAPSSVGIGLKKNGRSVSVILTSTISAGQG